MLDSLRRGPQICDLEHAELRCSGVAAEPVEGDDAGADAGSDAETDAESGAENGAESDADTDTAGGVGADSGGDGLAVTVLWEVWGYTSTPASWFLGWSAFLTGLMICDHSEDLALRLVPLM